VDCCSRQSIPDISQQSYEALPSEQRLTAGETYFGDRGIEQWETRAYLVDDPGVIDIARRLWAHEAEVIAPLGHQECVVPGRYPPEYSHPSRICFNRQQVAWREVIEPRIQFDKLGEAPLRDRRTSDRYGNLEPLRKRLISISTIP